MTSVKSQRYGPRAHSTPDFSANVTPAMCRALNGEVCSLDWPGLARKRYRTLQEEMPDSPGKDTGLSRKKCRTLQEEMPDSPGRNAGLSRKKCRTLQEICSRVFPANHRI